MEGKPGHQSENTTTTAARDTTSKPGVARKRKFVAEDAMATNSADTPAAQATSQAAATKRRKAAPAAGASAKPVTNKIKTGPPLTPSQVTQRSQAQLRKHSLARSRGNFLLLPRNSNLLVKYSAPSMA